MILRHLNDMMIHLIRNAIDHGIEEPAVRISNRKKKWGLSESKLIKNMIKPLLWFQMMERALTDIIRKSLIKKDLVTPGIVKSLSDTEVINYIFHPGFSTKEAVSDISGRGVGMDVVQTRFKTLEDRLPLKARLTRHPFSYQSTSHHGNHPWAGHSLSETHFYHSISFLDEVMRCSGKDVRFINQKPHILLH